MSARRSLKVFFQSWLPVAALALAACGGGSGSGEGIAPPVITQQPVAVTVQAGAPASFSVAAQSNEPMTYQWMRDGLELADAYRAGYTLSSASSSLDGSRWSVRVSNAGGAVTSNTVLLTVTPVSQGATGINFFRVDDRSVPLGVDGQGNLVTMNPPSAASSSGVGTFVLRKFNAVGEPLKYGGTDAGLVFPEIPAASAMDTAGNLYLAYARYDKGFSFGPKGTATTSEIFKVTPQGSVSQLYKSAAGDAGFISPLAIAVDDAGTVYVGDGVSGTVRKFQAGGGTVQVAAGFGSPPQAFGTLAVSSAGVLYMGIDRSIVRINADGSTTALAGSRGAATASADGSGSAARFQAVVLSLAPDAAGNLYVGDYDTIRKVTPAGVVTTVAGTPGQTETKEGPLPGATGWVGPYGGGSFADPYRSIWLEGIVGRGNTLYYFANNKSLARVRLP